MLEPPWQWESRAIRKFPQDEKFIYSWEETGGTKLHAAFRAQTNHARMDLHAGLALPARLSTDRASSHRGTQEGETLPGTVRISWSETRCDPESFSLARRTAIHRWKLPFFRRLALSNANRAGRIAFANCVSDWKKFRLAMQMRAARYVIQLVILIL
jgi:hypothetical protein